jgi:cytochrome c oxidase subunit IV
MTDHDASGAPHAHSVVPYFLVFIALMVLTAATTVVAEIDLGRLNVVVALTIAVVKALLVMLVFMELRESPRLTWIVVGAGFFWLAVMILLTMSDMVSRGWLGVPGS